MFRTQHPDRINDSKFASGPFALQWGRGTIKWRKVQVRAL
jgi:hypothetical protein